jgi:hypothetical protein
MTEPQARFYTDQGKYPLFLGGYGSGKTQTLLDCAFRDALASPYALIALYEPTYDLVRLILTPRLSAMLEAHGLRYKHNKQENIIYVSSPQCGDFVLRTLENPSRIVGYESYRAHVDELDTLKKEQATLVWQKIIARNRQKPLGMVNPVNRVSVYSTPEGFKFVYSKWGKNPSPSYTMVKAATQSNPFLPDDYIDGLYETYPPHLVRAYILGDFVNMASGSVYPDFDRVLNHTSQEILPYEALHIGMDFNVMKMAAVVFAVRNDLPMALEELTKVRDTPTMAQILKERYVDRGHPVVIYPDASAKSTSTKKASESDLSILRQAGFTIRVNDANPRIKDRVNAVNGMILNQKGQRRLKVNTDRCPEYTAALEQQPYDKNGEPDKEGGLDHINDAGGYFLVKRYPIVKRVAEATPLVV